MPMIASGNGFNRPAKSTQLLSEMLYIVEEWKHLVSTEICIFIYFLCEYIYVYLHISADLVVKELYSLDSVHIKD